MIQYLAGINCQYQKYIFCNSEIYAQRLKNLAPGNILADKLMFKHHLDNNDLVSALDTLEQVDQDGYYEAYYPELVNESYKHTIESHNSWETVTSEQGLSSAIRIAATEHSLSNVVRTCSEQIKTSPEKNRWLKACGSYSSAQQNSTTVMSKTLGLGLLGMVVKAKGNKESVDKITRTKKRLMIAANETGRIMNSQSFFESPEFEIWLKDLMDYGEVIAAQRLIRRDRKNKSN